LATAQARHIVNEVLDAVDAWRDAATQIRISRADIELTAAAFSACQAWREG